MIGRMPFDVSLRNLRSRSIGHLKGSELLQIAKNVAYVSKSTLFPRSAVRPWAKGIPRQSVNVAPGRTVRGGKFEIAFAQSFEEGMYRLNVSRRVRADNDDFVERGRNPLQTLGNLIDYFIRTTG